MNRHATQGTRMIIAAVSFPPSICAFLWRKPPFTLAAVVTYNTILTGLLSAVLVASQWNAIIASASATATAWTAYIW